MAENPIKMPLPANLPEDWVYGQTVGPNGTDVGLTEQHGYNYLMQQVNASQEGINTIGEAFGSLPELGSDGKVPVSLLPVGAANGIAGLDNSGKVPESQLPAMDYDPAGSAAAVQSNLTSHINNKSNPHSVTKAQVGLGNVDNTSDADKPISTATQTALNGKQATVTGGASTITSNNLTASRVLISDGSGKVAASAVTSTELGYLDGVTSNVQNQLNEKIPASPIFTYTLSGSSDGQDFATSTFGFSSYAMIQILINAKFVSSDDVRAYVRFNQGANIYYANSPGSNSTSGNNVEITTMNVKGDYGISAKIELQEMSGGIVGTLYGYGFNGTTLDYNVKGFYIPGVTFASLTTFGILKSGVSYAAGTTCAFYGVMKP